MSKVQYLEYHLGHSKFIYWEGEWERKEKKDLKGRVLLIYGRNQHNIGQQLSSN